MTKGNQAFDALSLQVVAKCEIVFHIARTLNKTVREKGKWRGRTDVRPIGGSLDDLTGNSTRKTVELIEVGLEEAPFHLGVIGEGPAGFVADAGRLNIGPR